MFQIIDFSIVFSWKIYPEKLDFRFSILYLCSVESSPRSTQSSTKFFYLPLTTNGRKDLGNIHWESCAMHSRSFATLRFTLDDIKRKLRETPETLWWKENMRWDKPTRPATKNFNESYFSKRRAAETQRFIDRESGAHSSLPHVSATSKKEKTLCLCVSALNKNNINYGKRNEQQHLE